MPLAVRSSKRMVLLSRFCDCLRESSSTCAAMSDSASASFGVFRHFGVNARASYRVSGHARA